MTRGYPLPRARTTDYTDVSPCHAADLNALQDFAAYGRHGSWLWRSVPPRGHDDTDVTWDYSNGYSYATSGTAQIRAPIQVVEGLTITDIACRVAGTGAGGVITVTLSRFDGDGTVTPVETILMPAPVSTTWTTYSQYLDPHIVTAAGESFLFVVTFSATNQKISQLRYRAYAAI